MEGSSKVGLSYALSAVAILAIVVLFLTFMFASFFQSIADVSQLRLILLLTFIASIVISAIVHYTMSSIKEQQEYAFQRWERYKKQWKLESDNSFNLVEGEKIIAPITTCFIQTRSLSWKHYARDVIVTNKRILIGLVTNVVAVRRETFGQMNLWNPNLPEVPSLDSSSPTGLLGGNTQIRKISLEAKDDVEFIKIEADYPIPNSISIYHPKSQEIYKLYRKAEK